MPHYNSLRDLRTKYLVKTMSEQSNKPSPDTARAGSPNQSPNRRGEGARERAQGERRAPMTQTPEGQLQTKRERPHANERGQARPEGEGRPQRAARPQGEPHAQRQPRAERAPRDDGKAARPPRVQTPLPPLTYPEDLPVSSRREEIAKALMENQVIIVSGETGSGKTTQLPKICLQLGRGEKGLIGHTQPRRIAASSTAKRIAFEIGTPLGEHVGFKVRFNDTLQPGASIKLMTDGILLAETQTDPLLKAYDTIIIDEAHERSLNIDFLLGYLKQLLPRRPDLKVIITSATIDAERFARHFQQGDKKVPVIEVSGRLYKVEVRYRPVDRDPVAAAAGSAGVDNKPAQGGKVLPVLSCKICKGKMKKGRRLERQTDGKVTKHNNGSLKRHLQNHGVRFGDQDEKDEEQQQQQQQQQAGRQASGSGGAHKQPAAGSARGARPRSRPRRRCAGRPPAGWRPGSGSPAAGRSSSPPAA